MHPVASEENYSDGQLIFKEGSPGDWVYVILSGAVEITKEVEGRKVVIVILKEGEVFGELGFLGGIKRTAAARAVGETTLGVIDRAFLDSEFNKLSAEFRSILKAVVLRFREMIERISESSTRAEPRFQKSVSLTYKDRQAFVNACTGNISAKGLFIRTDNPIAKGENFVLKLQLPDVADPLHIQSQVVWCRRPGEEPEKGPPGMGIMFLDVNTKEDQILRKYLQEFLGKKTV
jgi:uncharacterized protein (TIGR02266 family)